MYLLATLDTRKAEEEPLYKEALKDALSRAQLLWKMQTSSLKNAEFVKEKLSQLLVEPKNNLWSSQYEALKHLQQVLKDKTESLYEVCDALEVPRFRDVDKVFIEEYCRVNKSTYVFKKSLVRLDCELSGITSVLMAEKCMCKHELIQVLP